MLPRFGDRQGWFHSYLRHFGSSCQELDFHKQLGHLVFVVSMCYFSNHYSHWHHSIGTKRFNRLISYYNSRAQLIMIVIWLLKLIIYPAKNNIYRSLKSVKCNCNRILPSRAISWFYFIRHFASGGIFNLICQRCKKEHFCKLYVYTVTRLL